MSGEEKSGGESPSDPMVQGLSHSSTARSSSDIQVLYVDDDSEVALFFEKFLVKLGPFHITSSTSGADALDKLSSHHFDIVVSDYQMPGMNGITLLKKIRELPHSPPFILFTGRGREEVVMDAINNGAAFYLQKGGDPRTLFAELAHKIRQAVGQEQAKVALRESEEKFRQLYNAARDGILIFHDDVVIDGNPQATRFFGLQYEELRGKTIYDLSPPVQSDGSLTDKRWQTESSRVLNGDQAFINWRHQRADGSTFDAEASLNQIVLHGDLCIQFVIRDITDRLAAQGELSRRNAELRAAYEELMATEEERRVYLKELLTSQAQLIESEKRYRDLADLLPQVVYECDMQGKITYANRHAFLTFGYPPGQIPEDLTVLDMIIPDDRPRAIANMQDMLRDDRQISHEYRALRKDGGFIPVLIYSAPVFRNDVQVGFRGILIDITEQKEAEERLARSEERYRILVDHIQDGVFIIQGGVFEFVNPAFASFVGCQVSDLIGTHFLDIIAPDDREMVLQRHRDRVQGFDVPSQYEFQMLHRDGSLVLINMDVGLTTIQGRTVSIGTLRNITSERQAEEALRESERQLANVIDFLPDATFVINTQGRVITWNRAMEQLTGVSADEMLGTGDYAYALPFYGIKRPILIDLALQSSPPDEGKYLTIKKTGDIVVAEALVPALGTRARYLWGAASPLRNSKGHIIGAIESIRDVTDRREAEIELMQARQKLEERVAKRTIELTTVNAALTSEIGEHRLAEEALRESEERYRRLVEYSPDAILVHNGDRIFFVNPAAIRLFGASSATGLVGKRVDMVIDPTSFVRISELTRSLSTRSPAPVLSEEQFIRLDGTIIDVEVSSAPVVYLGSPAILFFVRDITRRKQAEEQLRKYAGEMAEKNSELDFLANQLIDMNQELDRRVRDRTEQVIRLIKQKDEFITQLGHDLKTPLTPLRALLPILIEEEPDQIRRESLSVLLRSVHSIQSQAEKILAIARLTRDDITVNPEPVLLLPVISESIERNWLIIEQKKLHIDLTIPADLTIRFTISDAGTVFDNLINNAAKYSSDGGIISIWSCRRDDRICIMVTDYGIGLSPEEAEHVFDEFYMADHSRHDRSSSGLGLSIVRRLTRLYGGQVMVESAGKGKGATFSLCIPGAPGDQNVPVCDHAFPESQEF